MGVYFFVECGRVIILLVYIVIIVVMSTGFNQLVGSTYYDVNTIFLSKTQNTADATNFFNANKKDLNELFEKYSNQLCNISVNYGFANKFQSKYFTPKATCSPTVGTNSVTLSFTNAAFNYLAITGSGSATITGNSGTDTYSKTFNTLLPDSNYSYSCLPYNTGTSPAAPATQLNGSSIPISVNTLPLVKGASVTIASYSSLTISWGGTNQSDCSYNYVKVGRSTTSGGAQTLLSLNGNNSIPNSTYSLTDGGLTQGTQYFYTITPYNTSNVMGAAISSYNTTPLNTTINSFSFSSVTGTSSGGGNIIFNANISNCSSATIKDNNSQSIPTPITLANNAFNNTVSVPFTTGYGTFTLTAKGGTADKTATVTFGYTNTTYTSDNTSYNNTNSGRVFWCAVDVIGGGGGGGGGGSNGNRSGTGGGGGGGGGGGKSSGGYSFTASSPDTIQITIAKGGGGNGGGNTNDGYGGKGSTGDTSSLRIQLTNNSIDSTISATGGTGGDGGYQDDNPGAGGGVGSPATFSNGSFGNKGQGGAGGAGYSLYTSGAGSYGGGGNGGGSESWSGGNYGRNYSVPGARGGDGYVAVIVYYINSIT
jgi:hypothetical protein